MNDATAQSKTESAAKTHGQSSPGSTVMLALFVVVGIAAMANRFGFFSSATSTVDGVFIVTALLASIAAFAPQLPWPNVLLAAALVAGIAGIAHAINAVTGLPFGQVEFTANAGPRTLGLFPWWLPLACAVIALSSRGTARVALHRSCNHPRHGYHVIALATGLALLATLALQAFATHGAHLWVPGGTESLFLSSGHVLHLFVQVAITPLLIDKFPGPRPANFRPLLVYVCLAAFLTAALV